jgi:hypothetical protein
VQRRTEQVKDQHHEHDDEGGGPHACRESRDDHGQLLGPPQQLHDREQAQNPHARGPAPYVRDWQHEYHDHEVKEIPAPVPADEELPRPRWVCHDPEDDLQGEAHL